MQGLCSCILGDLDMATSCNVQGMRTQRLNLYVHDVRHPSGLAMSTRDAALADVHSIRTGVNLQQIR